jgi:tRNA-(ms[2]io[6]A)-hydroxylase
MLSLRSETSPAWLAHALAHLDEVLVDHAHCEHKAAVTALSFVSHYPDDPVLVDRLSALAAEEADHLQRVAAICHARGLELGHPQKDPYAKALLDRARKPPLERRVDRLLICALIEARSCERLKLLAENLDDRDLRTFYDELWRCEAGHHTLFVELAERTLTRAGKPAEEARARLEALSLEEAEILEKLPLRAAVH